jgi:hypothetical protein
MPPLRLALVAFVFFAPAVGFAQNAPVESVRAAIESMSNDGARLAVRTRAG